MEKVELFLWRLEHQAWCLSSARATRRDATRFPLLHGLNLLSNPLLGSPLYKERPLCRPERPSRQQFLPTTLSGAERGRLALQRSYQTAEACCPLQSTLACCSITRATKQFPPSGGAGEPRMVTSSPWYFGNRRRGSFGRRIHAYAGPPGNSSDVRLEHFPSDWTAVSLTLSSDWLHIAQSVKSRVLICSREEIVPLEELFILDSTTEGLVQTGGSLNATSTLLRDARQPYLASYLINYNINN